MTAITRTKEIIEAVANKTFLDARLLEIVEDYIYYDPTEILTNEEKAQRFIDMMLERAKLQVREGAYHRALQENAAVVAAASADAVVDLT